MHIYSTMFRFHGQAPSAAGFYREPEFDITAGSPPPAPQDDSSPFLNDNPIPVRFGSLFSSHCLSFLDEMLLSLRTGSQRFPRARGRESTSESGCTSRCRDPGLQLGRRDGGHHWSGHVAGAKDEELAAMLPHRAEQHFRGRAIAASRCGPHGVPHVHRAAHDHVLQLLHRHRPHRQQAPLRSHRIGRHGAALRPALPACVPRGG